MDTTGSLQSPALLLIDMQEGFFETEDLAQHRARLASACNKLAAAARKAGLPVIAVRTVHKKDKSTWTLKMLEDDQGYLFEGTGQARILPELDLAGSIELIKRRDSAFWATELLTLLLQHRVASLILAGVSSETCIAATATDAFSANLPVFLARDALASADPDFEDVTLKFLEEHYRQRILSSEQLIAQLPGGAAATKN
ncbi:cysteine hydrolase [Arthrobacter sp. YC-RL1]|uniref:cysteine hydrolase family protein n=1 Tax=Arthrobacter sp. YC-RL1 TaxID=1652545 RepID=UPI00063DD4CB|nr:cysteine hydrolase [Arthrobacter sp. YC-RL1]ALQ29504.1 cysteine hydrolase [Arthrobacter sp. YC-RL1]KLI89116.1 cysteine hydrolase [Arthrobacter sp. YC-RL1]